MLANGVVVSLRGDVGDFVEDFANAVLGAVVVRGERQPGGWRALTEGVQVALAAELAHLEATAPPELRAAVLAYLLQAAVIDTYQGLLDEVYPGWRSEAGA